MSVPDSSSGGSGTLPRGKPNETGIGSSVPLGAKPLIFRPSVAPTGGTNLCNFGESRQALTEMRLVQGQARRSP